jgi:hypothetical protein
MTLDLSHLTTAAKEQALQDTPTLMTFGSPS